MLNKSLFLLIVVVVAFVNVPVSQAQSVQLSPQYSTYPAPIFSSQMVPVIATSQSVPTDAAFQSQPIHTMKTGIAPTLPIASGNHVATTIQNDFYSSSSNERVSQPIVSTSNVTPIQAPVAHNPVFHTPVFQAPNLRAQPVCTSGG